MTNEDKEDCLKLLNTMKETCSIFLKHRTNDPIVTGFVNSMDMSIDVLVEIIENKPLQIEKMFS